MVLLHVQKQDECGYLVSLGEALGFVVASIRTRRPVVIGWQQTLGAVWVGSSTGLLVYNLRRALEGVRSNIIEVGAVESHNRRLRAERYLKHELPA